jgi:hypothetical protein
MDRHNNLDLAYFKRRFTPGFAVFDLGFVKLLTAKHIIKES